MPAVKKIASVFTPSRLAIQLSEAGVRMAYPEANDREIFLRAAARRLSRDLMISRTQFARRQFAATKSLGDPIKWAVAAAEDTVLSKLGWYRASGETSERQGNDLRGIVHVSGARLDLFYLNTWAPRLGVADLLERLLGEARPKTEPRPGGSATTDVDVSGTGGSTPSRSRLGPGRTPHVLAVHHTHRKSRGKLPHRTIKSVCRKNR
jgi:hypothetical protein